VFENLGLIERQLVQHGIVFDEDLSKTFMKLGQSYEEALLGF